MSEEHRDQLHPAQTQPEVAVSEEPAAVLSGEDRVTTTTDPAETASGPAASASASEPTTSAPASDPAAEGTASDSDSAAAAAMRAREEMNLPRMPSWEDSAKTSETERPGGAPSGGETPSGGNASGSGDTTGGGDSGSDFGEEALQELLKKDVAEILSGTAGAEAAPDGKEKPSVHTGDHTGKAAGGKSPSQTASGRDAQERRRKREAAAEERSRKVQLEYRVIIGLLAVGIALCVVLTVILAVRPDAIFNRTKTVIQEETASGETTQTQAAEETEEEVTEQEEDSPVYVGVFELPLDGATGYAPVALSVKDADGTKVASLEAGEAFVVLGVTGDQMEIETRDGVQGWIAAANAWVNLPDLIPSIIYYDAAGESALFSSSGYSLPGITGEKLYNSTYQNDRFGEEQYCMPVLYEMALKIMQIQRACLANGESLKIYQTFRPYETQMAVAEALQELEANNDEVYEGLNKGSWSDTWFVATKLSNHQRGCAIDVSLVQVDASEIRSCGEYQYTVVTEYTEYRMPSDMHELSYRAAVFDPPVSSSNDTAWRSATYADTMTLYAYRLLDYCTEYGLSPLSSEWWHFNDLEAKSDAGSNLGTGKFYLEECLSRVPE